MFKLLLSLSLFVCISIIPVWAQAADRPNVIVILADDK